jgi:hypothetical protein
MLTSKYSASGRAFTISLGKVIWFLDVFLASMIPYLLIVRIHCFPFLCQGPFMARRKAARREGARILNLSQIYSRYLAKNTIIPHSAGFIQRPEMRAQVT